MRPAALSSPALCAHLAHGLHAAAQPLTILLAGLCQENTRTMQTEELRELTASSAAEVQRVCALFDSMQQLVVAACIAPSLSLTSLPTLLLQVADGVKLLFEHDGMRLCTRLPRVCPPLFLDPARTTQALTNVFLTAHGVSAANDTIEVIMSCVRAQAVGIEVRASESNAQPTQPIAPELSLAMAIAEANIHSQKGVFAWSLRPFRAQMEWHFAS